MKFSDVTYNLARNLIVIKQIKEIKLKRFLQNNV